MFSSHRIWTGGLLWLSWAFPGSLSWRWSSSCNLLPLHLQDSMWLLSGPVRGALLWASASMIWASGNLFLFWSFLGLRWHRQLIQLSIVRFTILEKEAALGGTWYKNSYPGCFQQDKKNMMPFLSHRSIREGVKMSFVGLSPNSVTPAPFFVNLMWCPEGFECSSCRDPWKNFILFLTIWLSYLLACMHIYGSGIFWRLCSH